MAKVTSNEKLLENIRRSRLVDEARLTRFLEQVQAAPQPPETPDQLARAMIEAKLLNRWQADNLREGKYKGFMLGKYKLLGHLGTGGMSSVYLAEHPVMERLVAIKVLPKRFVEDPNYLDRFRREARAAAALDHSNIVRAYDIDQDGNNHFIVMEFVEGRDLQRMVKEDGPLDPCDAADFIAQAAPGLQHSHDAGLVHRDIKPANCLVDKNHVVKLLDMGLAKFSEDDRPALSAIYDDSVVGTADYLAPEQARNSQRVDHRADIYSLGCTFYFLLTGQAPFPTGSIAERLLKHQTEQPKSVYDLRPDAPPALVELVRRMMIKDPDDRVQFAAVVTDELRTWLNQRGRGLSIDRPTTHVAAREAGGGDSGWSRTATLGGSRGHSDSATRGFSPRAPHPGETVSSAQGDTTRFSTDSSINDDLTLAPLEEEKLRSADSSGLHDDENAVEHKSSSSSIKDLQLERYGSGPLDALLGDANFQRKAQLPKTQLTSTRKRDTWEPTWIVVWAVAGVFAVVVFCAGDDGLALFVLTTHIERYLSSPWEPSMMLAASLNAHRSRYGSRLNAIPFN